MIQGMNYPPAAEISYSDQPSPQNQTDQDIIYASQTLEQASETRNPSKKQTHELKFIRQLKSKDIKLSHKKIIPVSQKPSPNPKHTFSLQQGQQPLLDQKSLNQSTDLKKSSKIKKSQNSEKLKQKQKFIDAINNFNPQSLIYPKQSLTINRDNKYSKKLKVSQKSNLQQKVRESLSQNKRQKISQNHNISALNKNNARNSYDYQPNIFQNIDLFTKQNSYHSLEKNPQLINFYEKTVGPMGSKIEEKLHLPSLVSNSGLKNQKSKIQQNTNTVHETNEAEIQKGHYYAEGCSKTQKSTPYMQKIVKIPIEKLKPLRPQEIKLKYERKIKEQQKNRAKQRAIQIFEKDEGQAEKINLFDTKSNIELQSDENFQRNQNLQMNKFKNKNSLIKQQKFPANRAQNIFKKKLIAYNGQY